MVIILQLLKIVTGKHGTLWRTDFHGLKREGVLNMGNKQGLDGRIQEGSETVITVPFDGNHLHLTVGEAKKIYVELHAIFGIPDTEAQTAPRRHDPRLDDNGYPVKQAGAN